MKESRRHALKGVMRVCARSRGWRKLEGLFFVLYVKGQFMILELEMGGTSLSHDVYGPGSVS